MVYFVGAGSGAADLITLRGHRLLCEADVIIYAGSLVNKELLDYAKSDCEIHNSALMTLEEVILVIKENRDKNIVRLHTGDPSLYGAIGEQMRLLDDEGICYEQCPGVSSFLAAAASLKTEYTLPGVSQSVIITRMAGRTPVPEGESIKNLSKHGVTMAIFLSTGLIKELCEELLSGAYTKDTPAAIVYKASWKEERVFRTTIAGLFSTAEENNIKNTALILVGNFLQGSEIRSLLYDPSFETAYRKARSL